MDLILDGVCVVLSLLLQHGIEPRGLAHSMGQLGDGAAASNNVAPLVYLAARARLENFAISKWRR